MSLNSEPRTHDAGKKNLPKNSWTIYATRIWTQRSQLKLLQMKYIFISAISIQVFMEIRISQKLSLNFPKIIAKTDT